MNADELFSRFPSFIQDYIYSNSWTELRDVQMKAADVLFNTNNHLLLSSSTASGKTEAAFFPILTELYENPVESTISVLYIAPLKSLINDQFKRMENILELSNVTVTEWHGDVSQSRKSNLLKNPSGILQITPESLEGFLIKRSNDIPRLFSNLRYIIIDEVHSLIGQDRGSQIQCQISRIQHLINYEPRRIGLSATMGDIDICKSWLSAGSTREVSVPQIINQGNNFRLGMQHFYILDQTDNSQVDAGYSFVYDITKNIKSIVFSNSREETEYTTATLRQIARKKKEEDRFLIHHGNLSAAIREDAELKMKDDEQLNYVTCATVTLELGIDIGKLDRIVQMGAPATVSSFLQRLGRSGRRDKPSEMIMVYREENPLPNTPLPDLIPWDLLQGIALIELYTKDHFIEPPYIKKYPFSLLFHQTLSILAENGELLPEKLGERVLSLPPFQHISKDEYKQLLIYMLQKDYLELTEQKGFIIGLKGERLLTSFKFYAVFKDSEDFTVRCGNEEIGTITTPKPIGDRFALAGKVWETLEVDIERKLVFVKYVDGKMEISWPGDSIEIHTRVLEKMREILLSNDEYPFLLPNANKRLDTARRVAINTGINQMMLLSTSDSCWVLFPWLGTKAFRVLSRLLRKNAEYFGISDIESNGCYYITFKSEEYLYSSFIPKMQDLLNKEQIKMEELIGTNEYLVSEKFDGMVPKELVNRSYAFDKLYFEDLYRRFL